MMPFRRFSQQRLNEPQTGCIAWTCRIEPVDRCSDRHGYIAVTADADLATALDALDKPELRLVIAAQTVVQP